MEILSAVSSGYSVIAVHPLEADATIVTCPFTLAITPEQSKAALKNFLPDILDPWNERQLMCTYMSFHRILESVVSVLAPFRFSDLIQSVML